MHVWTDPLDRSKLGPIRADRSVLYRSGPVRSWLLLGPRVRSFVPFTRSLLASIASPGRLN